MNFRDSHPTSLGFSLKLMKMRERLPLWSTSNPSAKSSYVSIFRLSITYTNTSSNLNHVHGTAKEPGAIPTPSTFRGCICTSSEHMHLLQETRRSLGLHLCSLPVIFLAKSETWKRSLYLSCRLGQMLSPLCHPAAHTALERGVCSAELRNGGTEVGPSTLDK